MNKYTIHLMVTVPCYGCVDVEATSEEEAKRIVAESIEKKGFSSDFWFDSEQWDTDMDAAEDLKVL
jgi:hypothetical protein